MVCALIEGGHDSAPWTRFLDMVRQATRADYATLFFRAPGRPFTEAVSLLSGGSLASLQDEYRDHLYPHDLIANTALEEGRPCSLDDVLWSADPLEFQAQREFAGRYGITGLRQVRVRESSGVDAWLTVARSRHDFGAADDALLRRLAPILRAVLGQHVRTERERFEARLTAEAVRRMQFGWFTLDQSGIVLDCDPNGEDILRNSRVLGRSRHGRLIARPARLQKQIEAGLAAFASGTSRRAKAIALGRDPWLDMLLLPAETRSISARGAPVAIAYIHGDSWQSVECLDQLAELFGLSAREAQIALALCRGMTIAEVAAELGVTTGTARNHTKSIYAKTGARGLPDLVRIVMRSILAMAGADKPITAA